MIPTDPTDRTTIRKFRQATCLVYFNQQRVGGTKEWFRSAARSRRRSS
jgi:hypothetical protein